MISLYVRPLKTKPNVAAKFIGKLAREENRKLKKFEKKLIRRFLEIVFEREGKASD